MLNARSEFIYNLDIDSTNKYINFNEGGSELTATLTEGQYSLDDLLVEIKTRMDSTGALTYTVSVDRTYRHVTISSTTNFSLLIASGVNTGNGPWDLLGLGSSDLTGSETYSGEESSGTSFRPQFYLQSYVSPDDLQRAVDESINVSASGKVKIIKFGIQKFIEMNITYITDITMTSDAIIENNATGVSDARAFLQYVTQKGTFDFVPDRASPSTFYNVILEKTPESSSGTGYRLKELYTKGLPYYYETGKLVLRVIE